MRRRLALINKSGAQAYAEIYTQDNTDNTTLNSGAKVQITDFDTNGLSNRMTPDHTNDHITVVHSGVYKCTVCIAIVNVAAQAQTIEVSAWKNNGATEFANVTAHRTLVGGGGDKGSMSLCGLISLTAGDTIELWANTGTAANRDVLFEDVTFTLMKMG